MIRQTFTLDLTAEEAEGLFRLCCEDGLSPETLLRNFVVDALGLSDIPQEGQEGLNRYLEARGYGLEMGTTFIQWLLRQGHDRDYLGYDRDVIRAKAQEDVEAVKEAEGKKYRLYEDYLRAMKSCRRVPEDYTTAKEGVQRYLADLGRILREDEEEEEG